MPPEGGVALPSLDDAAAVRRSLPHGRVAAIPGTFKSPGMARIPGRKASRMRSLADRHPKGDSAPVLYDAGSSCLEGRRCPLAAFGHSRDGKKGKKQTACGLPRDAGGCPAAAEACKSPARVERTFRNMKAPRLEIRPACVYSEERVRARVLLCMLAARVEWRMRRRLAPILFEDDDPEGASARRASPVAPAEVSDGAGARANSKKAADGLPARSMPTLLADLAAPAPDEVVLPAIPDRPPGHGGEADEAAEACVRSARD